MDSHATFDSVLKSTRSLDFVDPGSGAITSFQSIATTFVENMERLHGGFRGDSESLAFGPFLVHSSAAYHPTRAVRYALLGPYADRGLNF